MMMDRSSLHGGGSYQSGGSSKPPIDPTSYHLGNGGGTSVADVVGALEMQQQRRPLKLEALSSLVKPLRKKKRSKQPNTTTTTTTHSFDPSAGGWP